MQEGVTARFTVFLWCTVAVHEMWNSLLGRGVGWGCSSVAELRKLNRYHKLAALTVIQFDCILLTVVVISVFCYGRQNVEIFIIVLSHHKHFAVICMYNEVICISVRVVHHFQPCNFPSDLEEKLLIHY